MKNSIVTDGLTFCYDMGNERSFAGKATTNNEHGANARLDSSYNDWTYNPGGTWTAKHHDAIQVFNNAGTDISSKVNGGVTDYTNTYHGIWTYDEELRQPVVTMRDIGNGSWMYAGFSLSGNVNTPAKLGLGVGDNYVISWDQWSTATNKAANCGLYGQNATSTGNGFHDGLSVSLGQSTSFNTKRHTWQRCWCVYTVSSNRGLNATWSQYNYGHYTTRGVTKVANWQLETGDTPSTFVKSTAAASETTRSTALIDVAGGHSITPTNLTYSMDSTTRKENFAFVNTTSRLDVASGALSAQASSGTWTIDMWLKRTALSTGDIDTFLQTGSGNNFLWYFRQSTGNIQFENTGSSTWSFTPTTDVYYHFCAVGSGGSITVYINGVSLGANSNTTTFSIAYANGICIGQELDSNSSTPSVDPGQRFQGEIPSVKFYNRALSVGEVRQNFNALRGRFGY